MSEDAQGGQNLAGGKRLEIKQTLSVLSNLSDSTIHQSVPLGKKEDVFFLVDNSCNVQRGRQGQKSEFLDDCGAWVSGGPTTKAIYMTGQNKKLMLFVSREGKYCTESMVKRKKVSTVMEPQPDPNSVLEVYRNYSNLKADTTYKCRITWIASTDDTLSQSFDNTLDIAVYEYVGKFPGVMSHGNSRNPNARSYNRTKSSVFSAIGKHVKTSTPRETFNKLSAAGDSEADRPRNLKQVSDKKNYDKKKKKLPHTHQKNIADHFQHINNIVHTHPLVHDVIYSKDHVPSFILYTDEQIKDVKRFCASDNTAETTVLDVDKTYNLSQLHVTVTTFKNIALLRQSTNTHPLFLGPILIHGNSDFSTFSRFFETLKRELIDAPSSPIFGSDEERAQTKAIKHSFPDSHLLSCVRHLKSITINYLTDKVGVTSDVRLEITNSIYGENSMAGATDDIIFEIRRDRTLALVEQHAPTFLTYFNIFITPKLKDNMRTYNQHPTINPKWTNNNSESMNHILKLNDNWQSNTLADLINLIHTEITTQYLETTRAFINSGTYTLTEQYRTSKFHPVCGKEKMPPAAAATCQDS